MNDFVINSQAINTTILTGDLALDAISFNNYWLQNSSIITEWEGFWLRDYPDRRINMVDSPQTNWQIYNDSFFWWRTINIQWVLKASNKEDLDDLIDDFKLKLSPANKWLKWKVRWETRKIKATLSDLTFWTKENIYIRFNATFRSQNSFWVKNNQESILLENISDNTRTEDITNEYQPTAPMFIIWMKTWTVTAGTIKSNGVWITLNTSFTAGDILIVNGQNLTVTKNGVAIDYEWVFPIFETWSNNLVMTATWTYTADLSIIYELKLM